MKTLKKANWILITLLSLSAGIVKVMLMPQEVEFFSKFGLNESVVLIFGIAQIIAGLLVIFLMTRLWGALLAGLMFVTSVILLFMDGMLNFAVFSILPVILTGFIIRDRIYQKPSI